MRCLLNENLFWKIENHAICQWFSMKISFHPNIYVYCIA